MRKTELRQHFLQKRLTLTREVTTTLSQKIADRFFASVPLKTAKVIHTFLPIRRRNEPDTWIIIQRLERDFSDIRISIPRMNSTDRTLENFYYKNQQQLVTNQLGIPEPTGGEPTEAGAIDLILIPLLSFDLKGHRVGYGKGFYDRFLPQCRPDCKKIGIGFFAPAIIDDSQDHDQRLNAVVTPDQYFVF